MNRIRSFTARCLGFSAAALRAGAFNVTNHWALAIFSLVAAFGVWVAIQDVDNPQVKGVAPATGGVQVDPVNVPDGYLVDGLATVKVNVEARKDILADLRPSDFKAEVDVKEVPRDGEPSRVPVHVTARRDRVTVNGVSPETIEVRLIRASSRDLQVTYRIVGPPPTGYQLDGQPLIEPSFVTIRGRTDLVDSVKTVSGDVNLSNARDQTFTAQVDLAALSADGNVVQVQFTPQTAQLTFKITQIFSQRTLALNPIIVGTPAPGFIITNVTVDPPLVLVTGPKDILDGLTLPLNLEKLDVTGAQKQITQTKQVERPPNVSVDRQTVVVRVDISPQDQSATFVVAPSLDNMPAGLQAEGPLSVQVKVSGPLPQISTLKLTDIKASVSLDGATAGTAQYPVKVTLPAGLRADTPDPLTITLRPVSVP